jgi:hypothetical protein
MKFCKIGPRLTHFLSRSREWLWKRREEIRPWTTFVKTTHFEAPSSLPKLSKRVYKNIEYFQSNYVSAGKLLPPGTNPTTPRANHTIANYNVNVVKIYV